MKPIKNVHFILGDINAHDDRDKIKSKIGSFKFIENEILQDLNMYKVEDKKFKKL